MCRKTFCFHSPHSFLLFTGTKLLWHNCTYKLQECNWSAPWKKFRSPKLITSISGEELLTWNQALQVKSSAERVQPPHMKGDTATTLSTNENSRPSGTCMLLLSKQDFLLQKKLRPFCFNDPLIFSSLTRIWWIFFNPQNDRFRQLNQWVRQRLNPVRWLR